MKNIKKLILFSIAFSVLLASCSSDHKYYEKLKRGASYGYETPDFPEGFPKGFSYQNAAAPQLQKLKENYNLQKVVKGKSETESIIALLHWAYNIVPWDGSAPWPEGALSTESIVTFSRKNNTGVNCRMKAIILQEACLALGIPARIVSCIPMDKNDADTHVVTAVWSQRYEAWLFMDPSFDAYVMDEENNILSFQQIRKRLIDNKALTLNPEAEMNGKKLEESFYFDFYLMKNLYAMISPMQARYAYEGSDGNRYSLLLAPLAEYGKPEKSKLFTGQFRKSTFHRFTISNPAIFWASPK